MVFFHCKVFLFIIMFTSGSFWAGTSDFYVCRWLNLCKKHKRRWMWGVELFVIVGMKCFRSIICSSRVGRNFSPHWWWVHCVIIYVCWQHIIGKVLNFVVTWRTYFKSFFSKFSSSILKSSELMIFEGRSDFPFTSCSQNLSF